jgi:hypothetical protein
VSFFVEKAGLEFFGPYSGEQLLAMFHRGEISIFSLVRVAEVRPVEYRFFGELLLEIEPREVEKEGTEAPKTLEIYRPLHAELRYGHKPEFLASAEQRREDIQRYLSRKAAGL